MVTLYVSVLLVLLVGALIMGRKHPLLLASLLSLLAGVLIGATAFGHDSLAPAIMWAVHRVT